MGITYDTSIIWAVFVAIAAGTYLFRVSFIALFGYLAEIPSWATQVLRFVPMAVLGALVAPALLAPDGAVALSINNYRLLAGAVAAGAAYQTDNILATIGIGMGALYLFQFLLG